MYSTVKERATDSFSPQKKNEKKKRKEAAQEKDVRAGEENGEVYVQL